MSITIPSSSAIGDVLAAELEPLGPWPPGIEQLMHFVAGDATITDADGARREVRPGAVVFVPDGWRGVWDIRATVRKTYVIVRTAADS